MQKTTIITPLFPGSTQLTPPQPHQPPIYTIDVITLKFNVTLLSYLIHIIEKQLLKHLQLAWRNKELIQKVNIHLYCSKSKRVELLVIEPEKPTREFRALIYPLEKKIANIFLKNPVQKIELEVLRVSGR